ncbi:hypothetical protein ACJQWK_10270 [Exserohilum turcicum]
MDWWCDRCDRTYRTFSALRQHIKDSQNHYECPGCDFDGESWDDLLQHCRDEGCRTVCQGCNHGGGSHWDRDCEEYWHHLSDFNVCQRCERHFTSPDHLHNHMLSHRVPMYECYLCTDVFKTYGGMIIHLEYGTCSNVDRIELNMLAARCMRWRHFIDEDYRNELLAYGDTQYDVDPFMCPTCDATFSKLSGLFQHVESSACEQNLHDRVIGKLRNFLASRLN